jgi:hypothetical protein
VSALLRLAGIGRPACLMQDNRDKLHWFRVVSKVIKVETPALCCLLIGLTQA